MSSPSKCYRFKTNQFAPCISDVILSVTSFFLFWFLSVRPSPPKCWVEGSEEKGGTVLFHCKSSQGSPPLKYAWKTESGNLPPTATQSEFPPVNAGLVQHSSANTSSESFIFGTAWITCSFRPVCCQAKYSCCRWKQKHFFEPHSNQNCFFCVQSAVNNAAGPFAMTTHSEWLFCLKIPRPESC